MSKKIKKNYKEKLKRANKELAESYAVERAKNDNLEERIRSVVKEEIKNSRPETVKQVLEDIKNQPEEPTVWVGVFEIKRTFDALSELDVHGNEWSAKLQKKIIDSALWRLHKKAISEIPIAHQFHALRETPVPIWQQYPLENVIEIFEQQLSAFCKDYVGRVKCRNYGANGNRKQKIAVAKAEVEEIKAAVRDKLKILKIHSVKTGEDSVLMEEMEEEVHEKGHLRTKAKVMASFLLLKALNVVEYHPVSSVFITALALLALGVHEVPLITGEASHALTHILEGRTHLEEAENEASTHGHHLNTTHSTNPNYLLPGQDSDNPRSAGVKIIPRASADRPSRYYDYKLSALRKQKAQLNEQSLNRSPS